MAEINLTGGKRDTVIRLTKIADELLDIARRIPEAYDELCEASAQIVEAKRKMAKRQPESVKTVTRERGNAHGKPLNRYQ